MTSDQIRELVSRLDTIKTLEEDAAWSALKTLGEAVVPYLAEAYPKMRKWQGRCCCVFHSVRHARSSEAAFQLGVLALSDRVRLVRYRACSLLAYSLRPEAIAHLQALLTHRDGQTVADARAALDAVQNRNHHYFIDRTHSGKTFWMVNPGDKSE